jgi:DNA (cytosine-5)-methyltransferase 1
MTRDPIIRAYFGPGEVSAVLFAGLGGQSLGEKAATGRSPDIAINHWDVAIAVHKANHPTTRHYVESVFKVDPREATDGKPVALLWLSPDCTHHSKAKGGKPRDQKIRGLAWSAIPWAIHVKPRVIMLENVVEFLDWGPLDQTTGQPIAARKGQTFRAFVRRLEQIGYVVEWRKLRAHDYGAPTKRTRLFLIARSDGKPIVWPTPTHGPLAKPYRTAGECIDWAIPAPSIFDRDKPLVEKTLARVARGADKFVLRAARPFLVSVNHGGVGRNDLRVHDIDEPAPTITGGSRGGHALVIPYLVHRSNGERIGQAPRIYDVQEPLGTIVAQGQKHALCAAFLARHFGERPGSNWVAGAALDEPMPTITATDHHSLVAAYLCRYNGQSREQPLGEPLTTIDTKDRFALVQARIAAPTLTVDMMPRARQVAAFLRAHGYDVPSEFATVTVDGVELVVWDLCMRMLVAPELQRASGFPDSYRIDIEHDGKLITKTDQIRLIGNAVPPVWPEELIAANFAEAA